MDGLNSRDGGQKAVSAPGNSLHIARRVGIVAQRFPNLPDRYSQAVIEFDEGVSRPEMLSHFLAGDDFPGTLHQHQEKTIRQVLKLDAIAVSRESALPGIKLKWTETIEKCAG